MKKILLSVSLLLNAYLLFAQAPAAMVDTNTVKKQKPLTTSLKKTDGTAMQPVNDITTNISHTPELTTFFKAIQLTGLNETFSNQGPITVFAPANQAFNNLPQGKLDSLLKPGHKYDLIELLTYHAIAGKVTSKDIAHEINSHKGLATFTTLTGNKLMAKIDENHNIVLIDENGGQSVIDRFDIKQSNGLLYMVNAVLVPKFKTI